MKFIVKMDFITQLKRMVISIKILKLIIIIGLSRETV